jgi:hypothetical protein
MVQICNIKENLGGYPEKRAKIGKESKISKRLARAVIPVKVK